MYKRVHDNTAFKLRQLPFLRTWSYRQRGEEGGGGKIRRPAHYTHALRSPTILCSFLFFLSFHLSNHHLWLDLTSREKGLVVLEVEKVLASGTHVVKLSLKQRQIIISN